LTNIQNGELFSRAMIRQAQKTGIQSGADLCRIHLLPWPAILVPLLQVALAMISIPAWSQFGADSSRAGYDSIQDARMERMEWRTNRRFNLLEEVLKGDREALDSMGLAMKSLRQQLEHLGQQGQVRSEKLSMLEEELESSRRAAQQYRDSLRRFLWISGMLIVLLIGLSFLILLLFGMKTRHLVERLRWKQKQVNRELAGELKAHRKNTKRTIKKALQKLTSGKRKRS
jgi:hypothetical protein